MKRIESLKSCETWYTDMDSSLYVFEQLEIVFLQVLNTKGKTSLICGQVSAYIGISPCIMYSPCGRGKTQRSNERIWYSYTTRDAPVKT